MLKTKKEPPALPKEAIKQLGFRLIAAKTGRHKLVLVDVGVADKVHKYLSYFAKKQYAEEYKKLYT